jgi:hypothetical protein
MLRLGMDLREVKTRLAWLLEGASEWLPVEAAQGLPVLTVETSAAALARLFAPIEARSLAIPHDVAIELRRLGLAAGVSPPGSIHDAANGAPGVAWQELDYDESWDRFDGRFHFHATVRPEAPGIDEPAPFVTYGFGSPLDLEAIDELHDVALAAMRECTRPGERIIALDWQHQGYWFSPHAPPSDRWPISFWPDGDYHVFLAVDFSWGAFGHPWERTICIFGEPFLAAITARKPAMLRTIVRRSAP